VIPKLHKKGTSFRGAAAYLLHDKGASTNHRVAWTETRNLATDNPEAAWRVMAATALDQNRLKAEAGIKSTGRKSKDHVLHLTLSWHPNEAEGLTREEMMRAGLGALRALKAEEHQVLFVNHDDEPQPHLHLLISRVSPTDGRLLSSSKEKLALSRWAEAYERERGKILCEERVLNNAARDRGQFTRGDKEKPRHIYELEAANENRPGADRVREEQRAKDLEVRRKQVDQVARHEAEWRDLEQERRLQRTRIVEDARREETVARQKAGETFRDAWRELHHEQEAERAAFAAREGTLTGRAANALRNVDWRGLLQNGRRGPAIREAFGLLASGGKRTEALRRAQQRQTLELERRQREAQERAAEAVRRDRASALQRLRDLLEVRRQELRLRHRMEEAAIAAAWAERRKQRLEAWRRFERSAPPAPALGERGEQTTRDDPATRSAAQQHMDRMRQARKERIRRWPGERDRGRDDRGR